MKKKLLVSGLLLTSVLVMSGCGNGTLEVKVDSKTDQVKKEEVKVETPKVEEKKAEVKTGGIAPFFQTGEVEFTEAKELDSKAMLAPYKKEMIALQNASSDYYKENPIDEIKWEKEIASYYKFYESGTIKVKPYDGWKLINIKQECDGPCMGETIYRAAFDEKNNKMVVLEAMSYDDYAPDSFKAISKNADKNFELKALSLPKSVVLADGVNSLSLELPTFDIKKNNDPGSEEKPKFGVDFADIGEVAFTDPKLGDFYFSKNDIGCLYLIAADGTLSSYAFDNGFFRDRDYISIKWSDNSDTVSLNDRYAPLTKGCGIGGNCYFTANVNKETLLEVGKTSNGLKLYVTKDQRRVVDEEIAKAEYNAAKSIDGAASASKLDELIKTNEGSYDLNYAFNNYTEMYEYNTDEMKKNNPLMSFEHFVSKKPIIYWQDPFGKFSALILKEVQPPAECGKPVIYLYPEQTQQVSVKVGIDQFTKTEPAYGDNGWKVVAQPNGQLLNLADSKVYPYLFWEGISKKSLPVNAGFVVAKADVAEFLNSSLTELGLNSQEKADFTEFWLPKMQENTEPYMLISFLGTSEFNKIAPLDIQPAPDTLIRVFMYYQPLNQKISMPEQKLSSKERNGFTVVEWGGTSNTAWQLQ